MPSKPSAHSKSSNPQPSQLSNCSIQATTIQPTTIQPTEQARTDQKQHSHLINIHQRKHPHKDTKNVHNRRRQARKKAAQNTPEGWTKLTRRESHSSSPAPGRVAGLSALSSLEGPWKPTQRALPKGSAMELLPQRALPRKKVHSSIPRS